MEYQANALVCPVDSKKNVFTTAGIDNLDHNPSSATAESSSHGTIISSFSVCWLSIKFTFIQSQREQFWKNKTRQTLSMIHRYSANRFEKTRTTSFLTSSTTYCRTSNSYSYCAPCYKHGKSHY